MPEVLANPAAVTTVIRPATEDDIPRLVALSLRFAQESAVYRAHVRIVPEAVADMAAYLIDTPDGTVFVAERAGGVVGMIALIAFVDPLSRERVVSERVWYVEPEARGCGGQLRERAEAWARAQGATCLQMIAPTEAVGRHYERHGYRPVERLYQLEL